MRVSHFKFVQVVEQIHLYVSFQTQIQSSFPTTKQENSNNNYTSKSKPSICVYIVLSTKENIKTTSLKHDQHKLTQSKDKKNTNKPKSISVFTIYLSMYSSSISTKNRIFYLVEIKTIEQVPIISMNNCI